MYWGTGGRIEYIAGDFREVRLTLGLNPFTYNYVGTIFGGSMFSASDPFLMLMFFHILGRDKFVVWDKAARIRFKRPGKSKLRMRIVIDDELLARVRKTVAEEGVWTAWLPIYWLDAEGRAVAEQEREVYVADKAYYRERQARRAVPKGKD